MNKAFTFESRRHHKTFSWVAHTLGRRLKLASDGIAEVRRMRRSYEELAAMSNLELQDIGISRGDIPAVVAGTFRRERAAATSNVLPITRREGPRPPGFGTQQRGRRSKQMCNPTEDSIENEIDVRSLPPAQRHAKIFELVHELGPGATFILVNDHDPKPLYYQLEAEYPKQFSWNYLERGPDAWRVEIGKLAQAA
jgi:uncharacterized protein (DUF2249 family)/uncharacterized protein YjiS (DUF1127 family)